MEEIITYLKWIDDGHKEDEDKKDNDKDEIKGSKGVLVGILVVLILMVIAFGVYAYLRNRGSTFKFVSPN